LSLISYISNDVYFFLCLTIRRLSIYKLFPYTTLFRSYEKVDKRKSITKKLFKQSAVVDCHPLQEKALRSWMMEIANHLQIHLTDETFQLLESEFADDLYMLEREMEKLAL